MVEDDPGDRSVIRIRKTEKGSTERRSRWQSQLEGYTKTSWPVSISSREQTQIFWIKQLGDWKGAPLCVDP